MEIKDIWHGLDQGDKIAHLTKLLTKETSWQIFKGSMVPHDYASDTEDIINPDLLGHEPREDFAFKFTQSPPGCGKTHYMLKYIEQREDSQFSVVAHSNMIESELSNRMQAEGANFNLRKIYFIGKSLREADLRPNWTAITPAQMEESMLQEIAEEEGIIVIGTVKKLDDLRRRCREHSFTLRFEEILHDEFVRQMLDFFTIAKIAEHPCRYQALGDPMQAKVNMEIFQQLKEACQENMTNYRAALPIQFIDYRSKQPRKI